MRYQRALLLLVIVLGGCAPVAPTTPAITDPVSAVPAADPATYYTDYWRCVGTPSAAGSNKKDAVNACLKRLGHPPIP